MGPAKDPQQMAEDVAFLLEQRLRLKGAGLAEKLRAGRRILPRKVRKAGEVLASSEGCSTHPKLAMMLDHKALTRAYGTCMDYLRPIGARERFVSHLLRFAGTMALGILVVGGGIVAVLHFRGLL